MECRGCASASSRLILSVSREDREGSPKLSSMLAGNGSGGGVERERDSYGPLAVGRVDGFHGERLDDVDVAAVHGNRKRRSPVVGRRAALRAWCGPTTPAAPSSPALAPAAPPAAASHGVHERFRWRRRPPPTLSHTHTYSHTHALTHSSARSVARLPLLPVLFPAQSPPLAIPVRLLPSLSRCSSSNGALFSAHFSSAQMLDYGAARTSSGGPSAAWVSRARKSVTARRTAVGGWRIASPGPPRR